MPTLDEINGVSVRTPVRTNLDAFVQALNKIDQRDLQAREVKSKIEAGLSDLYSKLNVKDQPWLSTYIDDINKQINDAASFGNYSNALNTAIDLAGKAVNNPELHARMKANEDWEIKKKEIQALADSKAISQITRDRWFDQNEYEFDSSKQSLKDYDMPVNSFELTKGFNYLHAITLSKTTKQPVENYLNADGTLKKDINPQLLTYQIQQVTSRTKEQLDENFEAFMANYPEAAKSLRQDFKDVKWQIEKLEEQKVNATEEEKRQIDGDIKYLKEQISDSKGRELSIEQYLNKRSEAFLKNLVIDDRTTSATDINDSFKKFNVNNTLNRIVDLSLGSNYTVTEGVVSQNKQYMDFNTDAHKGFALSFISRYNN